MVVAETLVGTFLGIAQTLNAYAGVLSKASSSRRAQLAGYLDDISHTLKEMADDARANKDIGRHCAALKQYLTDLSTVLDEVGDVGTFDTLQNQLMAAASGRQHIVIQAYSTNFDTSHALQQIDEACGMFKATASRLRVPDPHQWWQFWKR